MEVIQLGADSPCKHTSEQDEAQDFYRQGEVSSGFQGLPPILSGASVAVDFRQKARAHLALKNLGFCRSQTQRALAVLHEQNKARTRTQLLKAIQVILKPTVEIYCFPRMTLLTRVLTETNTVETLTLYTYIKTIEMKSPNSKRDRTPTSHFLSPNKASSTRTGLHLVELLGKGVPWESPNNPDCYQDYKLLSTS